MCKAYLVSVKSTKGSTIIWGGAEENSKVNLFFPRHSFSNFFFCGRPFFPGEGLPHFFSRFPPAPQIINGRPLRPTLVSCRTNSLEALGSAARDEIHTISFLFITFRDREEHLRIFLNHIHPFLQKQLIDYGIYIIEQVCMLEANHFARKIL